MKLKYQWTMTIRWNDGEPHFYFDHRGLGEWWLGLYWLRINFMWWKKRD